PPRLTSTDQQRIISWSQTRWQIRARDFLRERHRQEMHAVIPVQVEEKARWALRHMHGRGNLSLAQLLKRARLIQRYGLDVDPECPEEHGCGDKGTAVAQVEIHLFSGEIGDTGNVLPGQDMHLFLIELFDIRD